MIYTWVNRNFIIRYCKKGNENETFLISAAKYADLLGSETANKHFLRLKSLSAKNMTVRLRRGLRIDFVGK